MFLNRLFMAGLLAAACFAPAAAFAKAVPGAPLIRHFSNEETKTPPSYLAIATGVNGEMYVGNIEGVLRYDGVDWRVVPLPGLPYGWKP